MQPHNRPGHSIEVERVRPFLRAWLDDYRRENDAARILPNHFGRETQVAESSGSMGAKEALSFRTGISLRTLWRIIEAADDNPSAGKFVAIETLDKLCIGLDRLDLLYAYPTREDGTDGFADVYFHPEVIGSEEDELARLREEYVSGAISPGEFLAASDGIPGAEEAFRAASDEILAARGDGVAA